MNNLRELNLEELESINGGRYYGNGVYCDEEHGCRVDWGTAVSSIANNLVNSIGGGLGGVSNPWAYVGNNYGNYKK